MSAESKKAASDHADGLCARLKPLFRLVREDAGKTPYGLEMIAGVARDSVSEIEDGENKAMPSFHFASRWTHGCGRKLWRLVRLAEDGEDPETDTPKDDDPDPSGNPD